MRGQFEPPSDRPVHVLPLTVLPGDIDENGHVNNVVYVRWIQDAGTAHWRAHFPDATDNAWVVLRHEIDYKTPACLGDQVVLRTWVGQATRVTFERFTQMCRASDDELLAQARTLWVPVNTASGRPTRVPSEVRALFSA